MRLRSALPVLACALALASPVAGAPGEGLRVLFIGNSLTYANDLPGLVQAVASAAGRTVETGMVAAPGFGLEDHWRRGAALESIREGSWDVVVLQQGPSSLPENSRNLRAWSVRFAKKIRESGGRPALLMVWPSTDRLFAFDDVRDAYRGAADAVDGIFLPAGEAWRAAWEKRPDLALYGSDGFHPSPLGSMLAAMTIVERLLGTLPDDLGSIDADVSIPPGVASLLRAAAERAARGPGRR